MKNALLALALFAFVGTASAHEGEKGAKNKKGKKAAATEMKGACAEKGATAGAAPASCCMKKGTATAAQTTEAKPAAPAEKAL